MVEAARLAEQAGFDVVWYAHDLFLRDAWVVLTAVAAATSRVKIGTCIVNPFTADPIELAMRAVTLHEYSGGRFILGIGPGAPQTLQQVGKRQVRPLTGLREAIVLLRRLLAGESVSFEGTVFRGWGPGAALRGAVPTAPIPFYIGGQGPQAIRLMGELGDGALPLIYPPAYLPQVMAWIREGAAATGRSLRHIDVAPCFWFSLAQDRRAAEEALRGPIAHYGPYIRDDVLRLIGLTHEDFRPLGAAWARGDHRGAEALVGGRMFELAILGTVAEVQARFADLVAQGVTQINVGPPLGPDPRRSIALLGTHVLPAMEGADGPRASSVAPS